jgi:aryl-alcohol dehydrogenase-like predicted oxidoreductase
VGRSVLTADHLPVLTSDTYRALGGSGIKVSPFGLGTVKFGRNIGLKYPVKFVLPNDKQLQSLLRVARELGINFLDTAPAYGTSEERLGKLLKGTRDQWVISTKVGENFSEGESSYDFTAKTIIKSLEHSLRMLQTDFLDLVLVHCNKQDVDNLENTDVVSVLKKYQEKGYIRVIGASTNSVEGGMLALNELDTAMITYNQNETDQLQVIKRAEQLNKGILLKKVLASGHAVDSSEALKFAMSSSAVTSAIIGTISPEHLSENVLALLHAIE